VHCWTLAARHTLRVLAASSQPAPGEALHGRDEGLGLPAWGGCAGRYMQATGAKDGIAFSYGGMISNTLLSHCVVEMAWEKGGAVLQDAVVRVCTCAPVSPRLGW
jgi:hypothetical protein